uniref:SPRY domain-containing protein n=1 Tax=Vombatus ursinus TaxID=29139 RepID=A0A4X2LHD4_VOMUR
MAASVFCCLRCCGDAGTGHIPLKEMPAVQLDTQHMGTDVVIVKNGRRICGTGGCLANAPLHQNKSYFEFKIQSTGIWGIGVATQKVNLNQIPLGRDVHSLVMRNDGALYHNNEEKNRLPANNLPQEGDVVLMTVRFWIVSSVTFIIFLQLVLKKYYLNSKSSEYTCIENFYPCDIPKNTFTTTLIKPHLIHRKYILCF